MADVSRAHLPVIDFKSLNAKSASGGRTQQSIEERHRLFTALRDTGFSYLKHPGINQATIDTLFAHSKTFFTKPFSEKTKILGQLDKGRGPSQGYSNPAKLAHDPTTSDIKEFFVFDTCHGVILELLSALAEEVGLEGDSLHPFVSEKNHFIACLLYPSTAAESF